MCNSTQIDSLRHKKRRPCRNTDGANNEIGVSMQGHNTAIEVRVPGYAARKRDSALRTSFRGLPTDWRSVMTDR